MSEQQSGWPTPQQQASKYAWKTLNYGDRNSTASYSASNVVATLIHMKAQIDVVIRSVRYMRPDAGDAPQATSSPVVADPAAASPSDP